MKSFVAILVIVGLIITIPMPGLAGSNNHYYFRFNVGIPLYGPPAYAPRPYWGPTRYYYPVPPVLVVPQQPPVYVQQNQQEPDYWYYCQNPQGYYPYIKSCPGGWMKVVPETAPPGR